MLWAGLGSLGHALVAWSWRTSQVVEFEHTVQAVARLAGQQAWKQPWESDPAWQALEQELDVDLVPLADGEARAIAEAQGTRVSWVKTPGGNWRASVTVPVAGANIEIGTESTKRTGAGTAGAAFLRGTRIYDDHGVDGVWWSIWSALNLLVAIAVLVVRRRQLRHLSIERENLMAWNSSRATTDDTSELEIAAHQLAILVAHLREGVLLVDGSGWIQLINLALCQQLEIGSSENLRGKRLLEVVRVPALVELIEHCQSTHSLSQQTIEVGSASRYLHLIVQRLDVDDGAVLLTATDVSSVQRSELARREFVTGASHELKTPLAAIRAYTETLQSIGQEDPDATERFLQKILDQADRMDRLVNSMLQLARAESGNLKLKVQPVDAVLAIKSCLEAAAGMAQAKGIQFQSNLPEPRTLVMADRDALQTIASNLLSNAVRYTPEGGRVVLDLFEESSNDTAKWVCLQVSDTGIGIAAADQNRIFERFYRVQKDRAVDSGGTGLGLAIVKQLTQVLGGSVQVISQPGAGTRFEIRLPAVGFTQSSSNAGGQAAVSQR